jgi:segregation and condensation protein A
MAIHYKLESFEGPLDLLLHLIDKNEIDIYDIPVSTITDQYMEYLQTMQELELDITSEFLVMAATLLSIKSRMLLPKPPAVDPEFEPEDEGMDPREELVQKLIEYRKYKNIAEHLRDKELARSLIYSKEPGDLTPFLSEVKENPLNGIMLTDLVLAFRKALARSADRHRVTKIRRDEISVKDRMVQMLSQLEHGGGKMLFSKMFAHGEDAREDIVVSFLSLLELMKMKKVSCYQHKLFDDIVMELKGGAASDELPADEINY